MDTVVLNHVKMSELPETWRVKLNAPEFLHVTVRIEVENSAIESVGDSLFGMWSDREDMANVDVYMSNLRKPRF